ncbi:MAG: type I phosphomannose isomerase catalytic subunit [Planctomycetota bacterium]
MSVSPIPLRFDPQFKEKPWGGRRLAELLHKKLPTGGPIGESWELVGLAGQESRVRDGPLAGRTLPELLSRWGPGLLDPARLHSGRFPLLIKFLDAQQSLSIQVHPKPAGTGAPTPGVKPEAWYVINAEPDAELYIGLKAGVTPAEVTQAAGTAVIADLLRAWPATAGACYLLPSGTPHALGAGIVVAEVQAPSDVTYRLYDWGRTGFDGRPRELHIQPALANIRYDVTEAMIRPPVRHVALPYAHAERLVESGAFIIDRLCGVRGPLVIPPGRLRVWIMLSGCARVISLMRATPTHIHDGVLGDEPTAAKPRGTEARRVVYQLELTAGDVVLFPAAARAEVSLDDGTDWLEVTIP